MARNCKCCSPCARADSAPCETIGDGSSGSATNDNFHNGSTAGTVNFEIADSVYHYHFDSDVGIVGAGGDPITYHRLTFTEGIELDSEGVSSIVVRFWGKREGQSAPKVNVLIEQDGKFFGAINAYTVSSADGFAHQTAGIQQDNWHEVEDYNTTGNLNLNHDSHPDYTQGSPEIKVVLFIVGGSNFTQGEWRENHLFIDSVCVEVRRSDQVCKPNLTQILPYQAWFRGPLLHTIGTGNDVEGRDTMLVTFQRFYGAGYCNQTLSIFFHHEDDEGYRYFISDPYENRNGDTCYAFAKHHRCKSFVNCWISTDSQMFTQPEGCSDSSNYLPIWDNGVDEDDDFNPDSPVDPIYLFGHDTDASFDHTNWQGRMLALNFPKRFYRRLDTIEIRNWSGLLTGGTIELFIPDWGLPSTCGTPVGNGTRSLGTRNVSAWTSAAFYSIQRPWLCFGYNGQDYYPTILGGSWNIKSSGAIYDCAVSAGINLYWINNHNPGSPFNTSEGPGFTLHLGYRFVLGELEGTITDDWSDFTNTDPVTKTGGWIGDFGSNSYSAKVTNLVLGTVQARGIFLEVF